MQPGNTPVPDSQRENVPFWFDPLAAGRRRRRNAYAARAGRANRSPAHPPLVVAAAPPRSASRAVFGRQLDPVPRPDPVTHQSAGREDSQVLVHGQRPASAT